MASKSRMNPKVGAVLVLDKVMLGGYNKGKTHTKYANPSLHDRLSIHAELDCLSKMQVVERTYGGEMFVYRELHGVPAMARPCNHCIKFLKEAGVNKIYYSIPHLPYWEEEEL